MRIKKWFMYCFLNGAFKEKKRKVIKSLNKENSDQIKAVRRALDISDIQTHIDMEIKTILLETNSNIDFYNQMTKKYLWGNIFASIAMSQLPDERKKELEKQADVLNSITHAFHLSW